MTSVLKPERVELAQRSSASADVTLLWQPDHAVDAAVVCVRDRETGAYFEIPAEPYLALDVYHHPYAYRDFSTFDHEGGRIADTSTSEGAGS